METLTRNITLKLVDFIDEIETITIQDQEFCAEFPDRRLNSMRCIETSRDEVNIYFEVTFEYELK